MILTLVRKLLRDIRWSLPIVALLLAGYQCLWYKVAQRTVTQISPFFATLAARAGTNQKAIEDVIFGGPGKMAQSMVGGESVHFERAMDVLSIGYVHPLMQIILGIWAIGRAAGAIAGELDRGTMELLLAQPIPRWAVVVAHFCVDVIVIPILCLSMWFGTLIGYWLVGPFDVSPADLEIMNREVFKRLLFKVQVNHELLIVNPWAFGWGLWNIGAFLFAVSGVTMAFSAVSRYRNRVIGIAIVIFLVMFLVNVVGQLWDAMTWMRPFTIYFYYQPQQIVLTENWNVNFAAAWGRGPEAINVLLVLFAVGAVGYALALWLFSRRDLPAPL